MPFYSGKGSAGICVVLGPRKSSTYSSEYASGFFEPAASHLPASSFPRNEGLLGLTPSARSLDSGRHDIKGLIHDESWWPEDIFE
jgi:hypothetical protein